jgi:LuxR family maltose regulon positive regulatory protein
LLCGDVESATEAAGRGLELEPDPASLGRAVASILLGASLHFAGEDAAAGAALDVGLSRLTDEGWRTPAVISGLGYSASIHAGAGRLAEAERRAAEAETLIESWHQSEGAWAAPALQASGRLHEGRGDLAAAKVAFDRAVVLARRGGRRLDVARALISLARLERRGRAHDTAREFAREARSVLELCPDPGALEPLLRKTERALRMPPDRQAGSALPVDVELSDQELRILRLLGTELSQREIGSELYISANTVKWHVRSIFRKLDVTNRADAVARARELGLM